LFQEFSPVLELSLSKPFRDLPDLLPFFREFFEVILNIYFLVMLNTDDVQFAGE